MTDQAAEWEYCRRVVFGRGPASLSEQVDELVRERAAVRTAALLSRAWERASDKALLRVLAEEVRHLRAARDVQEEHLALMKKSRAQEDEIVLLRGKLDDRAQWELARVRRIIEGLANTCWSDPAGLRWVVWPSHVTFSSDSLPDVVRGDLYIHMSGPNGDHGYTLVPLTTLLMEWTRLPKEAPRHG